MQNQSEYRTIADYVKFCDLAFGWMSKSEAASRLEEIEGHLGQLAHEFALQGLSEGEAEYRAIQEFGSPLKVVIPIVFKSIEYAFWRPQSLLLKIAFIVDFAVFLGGSKYLCQGPPHGLPRLAQIATNLTFGGIEGFSFGVLLGIHVGKNKALWMKAREKYAQVPNPADLHPSIPFKGMYRQSMLNSYRMLSLPAPSIWRENWPHLILTLVLLICLPTPLADMAALISAMMVTTNYGQVLAMRRILKA